MNGAPGASGAQGWRERTPPMRDKTAHEWGTQRPILGADLLPGRKKQVYSVAFRYTMVG
jgi:hypothetical protein